MIYDHRTYTFKPGTVQKALALYKEHGYAAQTRHLGKPIIYAFTEIGDVNTYVHVWASADIAERAAKRAAMQADPDWQNYLKITAEAGYLQKQENKILVSTGFES